MTDYRATAKTHWPEISEKTKVIIVPPTTWQVTVSLDSESEVTIYLEKIDSDFVYYIMGYDAEIDYLVFQR